MSGGFPTAAPRRAGSDAVLQRVTIVASHPDDTLIYLQADYSTPADSSARALRSASTEASAAPRAASTSKSVTTQSGLAALVSPRGGNSNSYNSGRGIELYASTQRLPAEAPATHIDVHA